MRFFAERRRAKALQRAPEGPLRDYLAAPRPDRDTPLDQVRFLAVDLETTGLDSRTDDILSIGVVPVDGTSINLGRSRSWIVRPDREVGESAVLHGLTDDVVGGGIELVEALDAFLACLTGRVMLAHHAVIEQGFFSAACQRVYGQPVDIFAVDTMVLQERLLSSHPSMGLVGELPPGSLRLWGARERYGLPRYKAHDALIDAQACAELYLAQVAEMGATRELTLRHVT